MTSINNRIIIHHLKKIEYEQYLGDSGRKSSYRVEGRGFIMVPGTDGRPVELPCWYTPSLPITVIGPVEYIQENPDVFEAHDIYSNGRTGKGYLKFNGRKPTNNIVLDTVYRHKKLFTKPLIRPEDVKEEKLGKEDVCAPKDVNSMTDQATSII